MTFQILKTNDPLWAELFAALPPERRDVFYSPGFARLCEHTINRDAEVLCAVSAAGGGVTLYPLAKRSLGHVTGRPELQSVFDVTSLYGRGGAVTTQSAEPLAAFHHALADWCRKQRVLCGFDRFHPVMANERWADASTRIIDVGGFVVVDLRPELEVIEASFKPSVRKDLRKAQRNAVTCFAEANSDHLPQFLDIYYHTMGRSSATNFYYFPQSYFQMLGSELPDNYHFFYAVAEGEIVSCELVLHAGKYAHSFLGGTKQAALPLSANPMLKWEIIRFLRARGVEYFLLGGGTRPDDGIFQFKRAYAPEGVLPSRIGGTIWDPSAYESLREHLISEGAPVSTRFQFYDPS